MRGCAPSRRTGRAASQRRLFSAERQSRPGVLRFEYLQRRTWLLERDDNRRLSNFAASLVPSPTFPVILIAASPRDLRAPLGEPESSSRAPRWTPEGAM